MPNIEISKVDNGRVYIDGNDCIAKIEEVDLPKVKFKFEDAKAMGLYSDVEFPTGLDKMESKLKVNSIYGSLVAIFADGFKAHTVIVRASQKKLTQEGVSSEVPLKAELRGFFKESDTGNIKGRAGAEGEATMSVIYYKLEIDGEEILEIDVFNNIYKVLREDKLSDFKSNIGG